MTDLIKGKTILVTGGTGTIGSKLVEELQKHSPAMIRVLSRDESKQHEMLERLSYPENVRMLIGDIRDRDRLVRALQGVDIVFHAAAMKHVPFCEYNPFEAVKTNIMGSQNLIDAALQCGVKKVVAISTDKVANPVGVMGVSKLMMEKLITGANYYQGETRTLFSCVRFGNVTWARGSVLSSWRQQAEKENLIKVSNDEMTRFFMTQQEAVNLVLEAGRLMQGGEIFVFKMPAIKIRDLADLFLAKYYPGQQISIQPFPRRAGEKLHEELLSANDTEGKILENEKMFVIIPPIQIIGRKAKVPVYAEFQPAKIQGNYSSQDNLSPEKIKAII